MQLVTCNLQPIKMEIKEQKREADLLRFITCGSVDDGKSTLIGRLLYDTKTIFEDQLQNIERTSQMRGEEYVNLALLTDGLRAEREQGITIDVAYRYFATPRRKFIMADTPGHIQYTRNMVTGASTANLAVVLVDARKGVIEQTCRHTFITSLLKIDHIILCVNKMDLVDYSQEVYEKIKIDFQNFISRLDIADVRYVPVSALQGDNIVNKSTKMPWYEGSTLLYMLENVHLGSDLNHVDARFPVQYVLRPQSNEYHDFRGYAGRVEGGVFKPGDEVLVLPSGFTSTVKAIETFDGPVAEAFAPMSVVITLNDEIDISRGDMLVKPNNQPEISQDLEVMVCWMSEKPLVKGKKYIIRHTTKEAKCLVKDIRYKMNINTLHKIEDDLNIGLNDIGRITLRTTLPLFYDDYRKNSGTGSLILVDEFTNETVAAAIIL
ncbi:Sulfate adenylyltransferase [Adhaeribacter pallidiroseus]|uniref:sulfate adenylyltransferase n=2 Tax=Adhaeribacter pallidiroseus TaxID=2072847 RepID=A0A369QGM1_9BACT|nr:Sulfate adenylyltransferase [Adhaeribacter pallidiroseus]